MKKLAFAIYLLASVAAHGQTSNPEHKDQTDTASPAKKTALQDSATPPKRIYIEPYFFAPGAVASSTGNVAVAAGLPVRNLALEADRRPDVSKMWCAIGDQRSEQYVEGVLALSCKKVAPSLRDRQKA